MSKKSYCLFIVLLTFRCFIRLNAQIPLFTTGQEADVILTRQAVSTDALTFHHPMCAMTDGTRFFVADTRNNRVLIWNEIPTHSHQQPDIVLGQPNFIQNQSGVDASSLNWPVRVFSDGEHLFVADTDNYRVLIWNEIPTENGTPADLVLGQPDFETVEYHADPARSIGWPWDVFYDGNCLYVVCTDEGRVLIWDSLPTINNQAADRVLGVDGLDHFKFDNDPSAYTLMTPRTISGNGKKIAVGDYNYHRITIWNEIPYRNGQPADVVLIQPDFVTIDFPHDINFSHAAVRMVGEQLFLFGGNQTYIWDSIPESNNQPPDRMIGGISLINPQGAMGGSFDGERLYVADTNGSSVLIYNNIYGDSSTVPDIILGQPDFNHNIFTARGGVRNCREIFSTGSHLFGTAGLDCRIAIWSELPLQDGIEPDLMISMFDWGDISTQPFTNYDPFHNAKDVWSDGIRLLSVDSDGIQVWNNIPKQDKVMPDRTICPDGDCGSVHFDDFSNIIVFGDTMIVSDCCSQKIGIWYNIPQSNEDETPDLVLQMDRAPCGISTNGKQLVVGVGYDRLPVWNTFPTHENQPPDFWLEGKPQKFNGCMNVCIQNDQLLVMDTGNNRVCLYHSLPKHEQTEYDAVLGQEYLESIHFGKSRKQLNSPLGLCFDGEYLWVSEQKFSDRILGYKVAIEPVPPVSPSNLSATVLSNRQVQLAWQDDSDNERGFHILFRPDSVQDYAVWRSTIQNRQSCVVNGLEDGAEYIFKVSAFNSFGESECKDSLTVRTAAQENHPPESPWDTNPQQDGWGSPTSLSWTCNDPDTGDVLTYDLYLGTVNPPPLFVSGLTHSYYYAPEISMPTATEYWWKVVAFDQDRASSETDILQFNAWGPAEDRKVFVKIESTEYGTTNPAPRRYAYDNFSKDLQRGAPPGSAMIQAISDSGQAFAGWTGDIEIGHEMDNPLSLLLDSDKSVKANFLMTLDVSVGNQVPHQLALSPGYPNPFNGIIHFQVDIPKKSYVTLKVLNILGQEVTTLISNNCVPGKHTVSWNATNSMNQSVSSGIFFVELVAAENRLTQKILYIK